MEVVDNYIFVLICDIEKMFLMVVEDVFLIIGWGIVVIGWIECGVLKIGDIIEIVGLKNIKEMMVIGIEMF